MQHGKSLDTHPRPPFCLGSVCIFHFGTKLGYRTQCPQGTMWKNMQIGQDRAYARIPMKVEGKDAGLVAKDLLQQSGSVLHQGLSPCPLLLASHFAPLMLCT